MRWVYHKFIISAYLVRPIESVFTRKLKEKKKNIKSKLEEHYEKDPTYLKWVCSVLGGVQKQDPLKLLKLHAVGNSVVGD